MPTMSKRFKALQGLVTPGKAYAVDDALRILNTVGGIIVRAV